MSDTKTKRPKGSMSNSTIERSSIRSVSPLGMRVLVRIRKQDNRSDGGLYLPEGAKQSTQESLIGDVIEVATAHDKDSYEDANVSGIPLGAAVLIPKYAGTRLPWDDSLVIVETKEILAIVSEVAVS